MILLVLWVLKPQFGQLANSELYSCPHSGHTTGLEFGSCPQWGQWAAVSLNCFPHSEHVIRAIILSLNLCRAQLLFSARRGLTITKKVEPSNSASLFFNSRAWTPRRIKIKVYHWIAPQRMYHVWIQSNQSIQLSLIPNSSFFSWSVQVHYYRNRAKIALSLGKPNNRFTAAKLVFFCELTKFNFVTSCIYDAKLLYFSCLFMLILLITSMFYTPITKNW